MPKLAVLISGAGIAGCTLAYWLARHGHTVTVVERSGALRSTGSPVDVRGPAADVAEQMGLTARLREASVRVAAISFLDGTGRRVARVDLETLRSAIAPKDIEIARGDLARILQQASADAVEYVFGDSIKSLDQDAHGVNATFERSQGRRFDIVVGADGLHSNVRRLAFGSEAEFVKHVGLYAATLSLPGERTAEREMFILNVPGKLAALHPARGTQIAYFVFWQPEIPGFDHTDSNQHKKLLATAFGDVGWRVPEFLEAARAASDLYFDSVARVDTAKWGRGRIGLLGDASACVSLFGDGSTLAIAGAYELAKALAENPGNPQEAFDRFQGVHGRLVASKQKSLVHAASRFVPQTATGVWFSQHVFWKLMGGVGKIVRVGRQLRGT